VVSAQPLKDQTHRVFVYRALQLNKRSQHFITSHDETLSVAMRVNNPNCASMIVKDRQRLRPSRR
jgi:hypothetical protein